MKPAADQLLPNTGNGIHPNGEARLLPALLHWLIRTGRIRSRTRVAYEVPWLGRRIDVALLTERGVLTAFELKIGSLQRVIEQASYNRSSVHRSWVAVGNQPRWDGLQWAAELGIGVVLIQPPRVTLLLHAQQLLPNVDAVCRLRRIVRAREV